MLPRPPATIQHKTIRRWQAFELLCSSHSCADTWFNPSSFERFPFSTDTFQMFLNLGRNIIPSPAVSNGVRRPLREKKVTFNPPSPLKSAAKESNVYKVDAAARRHLFRFLSHTFWRETSRLYLLWAIEAGHFGNPGRIYKKPCPTHAVFCHFTSRLELQSLKWKWEKIIAQFHGNESLFFTPPIQSGWSF